MQNLTEQIHSRRFILTEGAVIEALRREEQIALHPRLENALLLYEPAGRKALTTVYNRYIAIAHEADVPIMIATPTWRANHFRLHEAGIDADVNGDAVRFMRRLKRQWGDWASNIWIGGLIGCQNDCYRPQQGLDVQDACSMHDWQIGRLVEAGIDYILAATLPALPEAVGIARAARSFATPYIISFVINREGTLLDGTSLDRATATIDDGGPPLPAGYMINCAYPSFLKPKSLSAAVKDRLIGFQGNASSLDHDALDHSPTLRADPVSDWGAHMLDLHRHCGLTVLGGCCGTTGAHLRYLVQHLDID